ncbi:MAG: bifunctional pyr operon transcriptional regulator/uracil phosphoribosyltransferase PyrR [Pseudomonadota bacterium]
MQTADAATVNSWLDTMATDLQSLLHPINPSGHDDIAMIGVQSGGIKIAEILHQKLQLTQPLGSLNIAFYRDDFSRIGLHPTVTPSALPFDVENQTIILVDDVLYSGRTIRAAMNEIFDYGRPSRIILAVLVERKGHELPIRADVAGQRMALESDVQVKLDDATLELNVLQSTAGATA